MKWFAEYSPAVKRAWIIAEDGSTVVGPCVTSLFLARAICREHNRALDLLTDQSLGLLADIPHLATKGMIMSHKDTTLYLRTLPDKRLAMALTLLRASPTADTEKDKAIADAILAEMRRRVARAYRDEQDFYAEKELKMKTEGR